MGDAGERRKIRLCVKVRAERLLVQHVYVLGSVGGRGRVVGSKVVESRVGGVAGRRKRQAGAIGRASRLRGEHIRDGLCALQLARRCVVDIPAITIDQYANKEGAPSYLLRSGAKVLVFQLLLDLGA